MNDYICPECGATGRSARCPECGARRRIASATPADPSPLLRGLLVFCAVAFVGLVLLVGAATVWVLARKAPAPDPAPVGVAGPVDLDNAPEPVKAPPPEPEPKWTDAGRHSVAVGEVQIGISKVALDFVPLRGILGDADRSQGRELMVHVWVKNVSATRKLDFQGWNRTLSARQHRALLTDNFGNTYKRVEFGLGTSVLGAEEEASIHPGKHVTAVLVFEAPVQNTTYLRLELDPSAVGDRGSPVRFHIPGSMIQRTK
jgi:hypothetical protein